MVFRLIITATFYVLWICIANAQQADIEGKNDELKTIEQKLQHARERENQITDSLTELEKESAEISQKLVASALRIQTGETEISTRELKIVRLNENERLLTRKMASKRNALGELLVGLQRLEHDPPPPLAAHPKDALDAIRSATLFGSIIPMLKAEASAIRHDLLMLENVRAKLQHEKQQLQISLASLNEARHDLELLRKRKQEIVLKTRGDLAEEKARTAALAKKAKNLQQLLKQIAEEKLRAAKRLKDEQIKREIARQARINRPKIAFSRSKGLLDLPATGAKLHEFHEKNRVGQTTQGIFIATRKQAQVTSPVDGVVEFAGEFRSYGQLLIVNAGEGYHVLLAGLGKIDVNTGQQLRAGEPVGQMGRTAARATLIAATVDDPRPVLYIEFRKQGRPIDPAPWWRDNRKEARK